MPDTPEEVREEVSAALEYLKRQIGALRVPKAPPESVEERLEKIREQVALMRGKT